MALILFYCNLSVSCNVYACACQNWLFQRYFSLKDLLGHIDCDFLCLKQYILKGLFQSNQRFAMWCLWLVSMHDLAYVLLLSRPFPILMMADDKIDSIDANC